jgi:hypothetical protein
MRQRLLLLIPILIFVSSCAPDATTVAINEQIKKDQERVSKCSEVENVADDMDEFSASLVRQAKELQRKWITQEMINLHSSGKISDNELEVFNNQLRTDRPFPPVLPGGEFYELMEKVVKKGYIKPYLPKEVVEIGERAALSPKSVIYKIGFPECFSELEYGMLNSLAALKPTKGAWSDKLSPSGLLP